MTVLQAFTELIKETPDWGPAEPKNRTGRYAEKDEKNKREKLSYYNSSFEV